MKCADYMLDEDTIDVETDADLIVHFDINTVSIINQDAVEQDITARTLISSEDNIVTFSKANFKQKLSNQSFRGELTIKHKSGLFQPYQLSIITIKPIGE